MCVIINFSSGTNGVVKMKNMFYIVATASLFVVSSTNAKNVEINHDFSKEAATFTLEVDAKSNCLNVNTLVIKRMATIKIPRGNYKISLNSDAFFAPGELQPVTKVIFYTSTPQNPEGYFILLLMTT